MTETLGIKEMFQVRLLVSFPTYHYAGGLLLWTSVLGKRHTSLSRHRVSASTIQVLTAESVMSYPSNTKPRRADTADQPWVKPNPKFWLNPQIRRAHKRRTSYVGFPDPRGVDSDPSRKLTRPLSTRSPPHWGACNWRQATISRLHTRGFGRLGFLRVFLPYALPGFSLLVNFKPVTESLLLPSHLPHWDVQYSDSVTFTEGVCLVTAVLQDLYRWLRKDRFVNINN